MKIGRRKFFQALGAAPLVARQVAEEAAKKLTSLGGAGMGPPSTALRDALREGAGNGPYNTAQSNPAPGSWRLMREVRDKLIRKALDTPSSRAELESLLYADNRHVWCLDYDLAANKSMSLAAKITFQRQRIVQRAIVETIEEKNFYSRINEWKERILSVAGIKL